MGRGGFIDYVRSRGVGGRLQWGHELSGGAFRVGRVDNAEVVVCDAVEGEVAGCPVDAILEL